MNPYQKMLADKRREAKRIERAEQAKKLALSDPEKCKNAARKSYEFKAWAELHPEELVALNEEVRKKALIRARQLRPEQRKNLWNERPHLRMAHNVRTRINLMIKANGWTKECKTGEMLGCDWNHFKSHIESLFVEGMDWRNYGEWVIDHIVPLSTATDCNQVNLLNHHTNLQPLWWWENAQKGDKLDWVRQTSTGFGANPA